jgi:hypothetical protein
LEQLAPSLVTFKDRPPRREPPNIMGTKAENTFYIPSELGGEPGLVQLSDGLEGRFVIGHAAESPPAPLAA